MAIDTNGELLLLIDMHMPWGAPPWLEGTYDQEEHQTLLHQYPGIDFTGSSFILYNGESGQRTDYMVFCDLGAVDVWDDQKIAEQQAELTSLNEKLERLLKQAEIVTDLVLNPGEK